MFRGYRIMKTKPFSCKVKISFEFCRRETAIQYVLHHSCSLYCWPEQYPEDFLTRHLLKISIFDDRLVPRWGSFNNYVDKFSLFITTYLPLRGHFFTLNVDKNGHFWTTYPPHLVDVVFERPEAPL